MPLVSHSPNPRDRQPTRTVLVIEDPQGKRIINLDKNIYSLGRDSKNSIVLRSPHVSRYHATLLRVYNAENDSYLFQIIDGDLQGNRSTNGLKINGKKNFSKSLQNHDMIQFAEQVKAYYIVTNPEVEDSVIYETYQNGEPKRSEPAAKRAAIDPFETVASDDTDGEALSDVALFRLASFPELLPSPIIEIDLSGKLTYLNPAALIKIPDLPQLQIQHPVLQGLTDAVQNEGKQFFMREVAVGNSVFEQTVHYISESRLIRSYLADITKRQQMELALRESEERYALAARAANDGLWDWKIKTNEIYYSPRWKSMLGLEDRGIGNSLDEWFNRVHPEDLQRVQAELAAHVEGTTSHFKSEYRMLHKDGRYRWMLSQGIAVQDEDGQVYRMAGSQTDISDRKQAEAQLLHDALHDALTGLPNRVLLMDRLGHALEMSKRRQDYLFAVLFLDLDRFKIVNDSLGHQSGDQLLMALVKRLEHCIRSADTLARLGGDEFSILLQDIRSINDAKYVAERLQKQLALPFNINGQEIFTSASIGIALSTKAYNTAEEVIRDADIAMYRAKAQGKACYEIFDPTMHNKALTLLQLENDLRRATERQDLMLHYQPIVGMTTGKITGFEALLRWQHPERGWVSPTELIPVAEDTGLIIPIGYWVLREACRQLRIWQQLFPVSPPLSVSVNLSGKQFREGNLLQQIQKILVDTGVPPSTLRLEITESVIVENAETAAKTLSQLREMGVQIYVDDFGTGYSSLSYLHQFPLDALKIDRSFINRMSNDSESIEIVQTIINLAQNLKIYTIAEGVETKEQWDMLKQIVTTGGHCQGYYFSRPIDIAAVEELMAKSPQW
ncbi:MAG: EAL domain-containing protein [Cyanosarcina radialis HA8281-LM2]|jgi:diguanylate cyclase (GGDEF)-like protein/PAS domain S-box-containing protein|nr:EAL domain-containing protein [Cyanosarcina radialis HA8281-LM2]